MVQAPPTIWQTACAMAETQSVGAKDATEQFHAFLHRFNRMVHVWILKAGIPEQTSLFNSDKKSA